MADVNDVLNAIVTAASVALYPNGTGQASAAGGIPCMIYPGWPIPTQLDADLALATPKAHVSVFPRQEERNTTRYPQDWQVVSITTPTITIAANGQQLTIGGAMPSPFATHNVMALISGQPYVYAVQSSDTLASIAASFAALIGAAISGTSSAGAVITVGSTGRVTVVRIGVTGTSVREIRRQERVFQVTIWANTPANRTSVASILDVALSAITYLTMPDQTGARIIYKGSPISDGNEKARLYRRDLLYTVEYATTQTAISTQITEGTLNISNQPDGATAVISSITINS